MVVFHGIITWIHMDNLTETIPSATPRVGSKAALTGVEIPSAKCAQKLLGISDIPTFPCLKRRFLPVQWNSKWLHLEWKSHHMGLVPSTSFTVLAASVFIFPT